ncbi:MAG TPA: stage II sporulation protein P [Limnochordia bacterium]
MLRRAGRTPWGKIRRIEVDWLRAPRAARPMVAAVLGAAILGAVAFTWPLLLSSAQSRVGPLLQSAADRPDWARRVFQDAFPLFSEFGPEPPPPLDWQRSWRATIFRLTGYDFGNVRSLLAAELPPGPSGPAGQTRPQPEPLPTPERQPAPPPRPTEPPRPAQPRVAILHSHTSEMYRRPDFHPESADAYHRFNTADTGVVRVGDRLAAALSERGIASVHVTKVHDFPTYARAYIESEKTITELLRRYPQLDLILDVHRDGAEGVSFLREVAGETVAGVAIVIGTGRAIALPNPRWEENLALARSFASVANAMYPGLVDRILIADTGRYNQHLDPGVLLFEVGSYYDDEKYALRTAELLADVIAALLAKGVNPAGERAAE